MWVTNSAVRSRAVMPTATPRISTARPQSNSRSVLPMRTSVDGPARSAVTMGEPLPRMTTCMEELSGEGFRRREESAVRQPRPFARGPQQRVPCLVDLLREVGRPRMIGMDEAGPAPVGRPNGRLVRPGADAQDLEGLGARHAVFRRRRQGGAL